jgi:transposase-like protein
MLRAQDKRKFEALKNELDVRKRLWQRWPCKGCKKKWEAFSSEDAKG